MPGRYGFGSVGNAMTSALERELATREALKRQAMLDQLMQQKQQQEAEQAAAELQMRQQQLEMQRQQMEERAAASRAAQSTAANQRGMRQMIGDRLMQGPLDPTSARQIAAMGYTEDVEVPGIVDQAMAPPKRTLVRNVEGPSGPQDRAFTDEELAAGVDLFEKPDASQWQSAGQGVIFNPATGEFKRVPGGGGGGAGGPADASQDYTMRSKSRLLSAIDKLEPLISDKTVGTWRARGARVVKQPGDPVVDFDAKVTQIAALIGFDELNAMRQASKTGGALGQVSERELKYLQSVAGSLDPNQSQEAFREQLRTIRAEIQRVVDYGLEGGGRGAGGGPGPSGVQRWGRDAQGRPVRLP